MNRLMNRTLRSLRRGQAGFALVEALISAALLAMISLSVLAGIDATANSTGREKARAAGVMLAEQDQERMRAMRAEELETYSPLPRTEVIDGITYSIASKGVWIRDDTGGTQSCTNNEKQVDYLKITSTVTSNRKNTKPVTLTSLVSPPPASPQGTLVVKVLNRDNAPVTNLPVAITGASSATATTNDVGCALFPQVAVGSYTVTLNKPGGNYPSVDKAGNAPATLGTEVTVGAVRYETMYFDQSGRIPVKFNTTDLPGLRGTAGGTLASTSRYARVSPPPPTTRAAFDAGAPATQIIASNLFPFVEPYGVFAGRCDGAKPAADDILSIPVARGADTAAVTVRQPALNVRVDRRTGSTAVWAENATVKATMTDGSGCSDTIDLVTTNGTSAQDGWVSKDDAIASYDPGIPYGTWTVCAQWKNSSGNWRKDTATIVNSEPGGNPATTKVLAPLIANVSGTC